MSNTNNFFSRQDLGGVNPDDFHRDLRYANLKVKYDRLLEAMVEINSHMPVKPKLSLTKIIKEISENALKAASQSL